MPLDDTSLSGADVAWIPQVGSQTAFLACPFFEVLYEGTRGPGKTDALLMDFAKDCNKGHGAAWKGILFRQTYKQLTDVISKSKKWFMQLSPRPVFNASEHFWTWLMVNNCCFASSSALTIITTITATNIHGLDGKN